MEGSKRTPARAAPIVSCETPCAAASCATPCSQAWKGCDWQADCASAGALPAIRSAVVRMAKRLVTDLAPSAMRASVQRRRPGRIGGQARCRDALLREAHDRHLPELGALAEIAEEHQVETVRGPGRAFIVIALGQHALGGTIRPHDADGKLAARLLGEGDEVAARGPDRRRVAPFAEGDALRVGAVGAHDEDLLGAAATRLEDAL